MTTSFPFLKIARDHNAPYASVVRMSEAMPRWVDDEPLTDQEAKDFEGFGNKFVIVDILTVGFNEHNRRTT